MTKLEQLQKDKEELTVKLHIYQDKSIIDEEIINTLKEKNKHYKSQLSNYLKTFKTTNDPSTIRNFN